jgi:hypothetical protein
VLHSQAAAFRNFIHKMSDPELHEITSIAPKWDPLWVISRRGFILVSERLAECEHENYDLQRDLSDVDLPLGSCIIPEVALAVLGDRFQD